MLSHLPLVHLPGLLRHGKTNIGPDPRLIVFRSVAQSCPTLHSPMYCSTPGFPVQHQLSELTQSHFRRVSDAIQQSHPLLSHLQSSILPSITVFFSESVLRIRWPNIGVSPSASVLPKNIWDWFPFGWTDWISLQSKGLTRVFTPQSKSINSLVLSFLYGPTLTSIRDYWKNHSFDQTDLCWQSNVSAL